MIKGNILWFVAALTLVSMIIGGIWAKLSGPTEVVVADALKPCPSREPCPDCVPCPCAEPDSEFDKPEPECRDGEKLMEDCAPKKRLENKGNRNWCVEVAEGPPGTDDHVMHRVGYQADDKLRKHVAWVRHGLGTRAKDQKRVVRYYNVTHEVAQAVCPFLDCSEMWLGTGWEKWPGVVGTCRVMKGKECDH
jgi:hypothetical protein